VAGFMLSTAAVGYYSAALRIIIIIQSIVSMPLNTVLFPYIGEAFVKGYSEGIRRINKAFPYLVLLAVAMAVGTFIISKPLILLFFGKEFAESVFLLKILAVALFISTINSALGQQVMLNLKKDAAQIKFITSGFILNLLFLLLFINSYGTVGAAIAWPASELLILISYVIYFRMNSIRIMDSTYYNPRLIMTNTLKMIRSKAALR
jgi:O-antigen/teichoic acid export membrane protein